MLLYGTAIPSPMMTSLAAEKSNCMMFFLGDMMIELGLFKPKLADSTGCRYAGEIKLIMHYANAKANRPATSITASAGPQLHQPMYSTPPVSSVTHSYQTPAYAPPPTTAYLPPPSAYPPPPQAYPASSPYPAAYPSHLYPPPAAHSPYPPPTTHSPYPPPAYPPPPAAYPQSHPPPPQGSPYSHSSTPLLLTMLSCVASLLLTPPPPPPLSPKQVIIQEFTLHNGNERLPLAPLQ
ncbi:hypothetical protein Cgig2_032611 [Carnegiea gigantea]|uniref:Extensin-like n=1 Tax=Carnegiea gigantea TaxID=171969 RepID=A0A9Q1KU63_9CARY|nr:hypothetical protein Cgig2_032611 [Carnegiea gigantea]